MNGYDDVERPNRRQHVPAKTKKQVMTDPIMKKSHVHAQNRNSRNNVRGRLKQIDLDIEYYDDDEFYE